MAKKKKVSNIERARRMMQSFRSRHQTDPALQKAVNDMTAQAQAMGLYDHDYQTDKSDL